MAKPKDSERGANILNSPEERKKFKSALSTITHYYQQQDDLKESLKDTISDISEQFSIEKKHVTKLAKTMFKSNYQTLQDENRHFEILYELLVEGKLRDDHGDPLMDLAKEGPDDDLSNDDKDLE